MPKSPVVDVKVPLRSGFDKSHHTLLTTKVGTITPLLVDELVPNSRVSVRLALSASLPPLAVDTFMKCDIKCEAFFVPMRILYGGFEEYFCDVEAKVYSAATTTPPFFESMKPYLPSIQLKGWEPIPYDSTDPNSHDYDPWGYDAVGPGTLADYLGIKVGQGKNTGGNAYFLTFQMLALPFVAYQKIWDDWYRNTLVQQSCFCRDGGYLDASSSNAKDNFKCARLPYITLRNASRANVVGNPANYGSDNAGNPNASQVWDDAMADFHPVWKLRQRNFGFDYFTNAQPTVALGGDVSVSSSSSFTISALRAANSLQMFRERNSLAGSRFVDVLSARYGANLSDGVAQRSVFLGSASYPVYSRGVSVNGGNAGVASTNPFSENAGAQVGQAYASGTDKIVDNFVANEPGYLFVMGTLVPKVTYSSGIRRYLRHGLNNITDFANPLLQNVGNQPVYDWELSDSGIDGTGVFNIFGYTDRYAEYMTIEDQVHGLITEGCSLEAFAAQRYVEASNGGNQISTAFLQIPTDYLDNVTSVKSTLSDYGVWIDCDFQYHVSQPLAEYSIPSLQDPAYEHGQTIKVHRGGFRF